MRCALLLWRPRVHFPLPWRSCEPLLMVDVWGSFMPAPGPRAAWAAEGSAEVLTFGALPLYRRICLLRALLGHACRVRSCRLLLWRPCIASLLLHLRCADFRVLALGCAVFSCSFGLLRSCVGFWCVLMRCTSLQHVLVGHICHACSCQLLLWRHCNGFHLINPLCLMRSALGAVCVCMRREHSCYLLLWRLCFAFLRLSQRGTKVCAHSFRLLWSRSWALFWLWPLSTPLRFCCGSCGLGSWAGAARPLG